MCALSTIHHPSDVIDPVLYSTLREYAADAELIGRLHDEQLHIIYQQKWFNLFVPQQHGGLGLSLPDALRLEEALAWTDGSVGWTVTLCSGANWFVGFLTPSAAATLYSNRKVCLAGSGKPSGVAQVTDAGYIVNGQWNYATGALHATAYTTNCLIQKDGVQLMDDHGHPLYKSFWFHPHEVTIHKNWHTIGMIATSSAGFSINHLTVPFERSFMLEPGKAVLTDAVFHFPFLQFAEVTLAVNFSGMAARFLDLCEAIFEERQRQPNTRREVAPPFQPMLRQAQRLLREARMRFYEAVDQSWQSMTTKQAVSEELLRAMSETSRQLALISREQVDLLYPFCGMAAADPSTPINRVWRDLHTASQHALLNYPLE